MRSTPTPGGQKAPRVTTRVFRRAALRTRCHPHTRHRRDSASGVDASRMRPRPSAHGASSRHLRRARWVSLRRDPARRPERRRARRGPGSPDPREARDALVGGRGHAAAHAGLLLPARRRDGAARRRRPRAATPVAPGLRRRARLRRRHPASAAGRRRIRRDGGLSRREALREPGRRAAGVRGGGRRLRRDERLAAEPARPCRGRSARGTRCSSPTSPWGRVSSGPWGAR